MVDLLMEQRKGGTAGKRKRITTTSLNGNYDAVYGGHTSGTK